ncbi:MAG: hypothetical protein K940chlam1_00250 [Candidatus Anoxychlamydiales bacterium]|nr:hypothetical protein [Candidatus Anoxychlamydiales bacterium]NGX35698.1 hypothetical protein [Candidatus Anoxychlamydiales bacterium]
MTLTDEPLLVFYTLIPLILRKEFHANALHISLFTMIRPVLSSFSFFWGASLTYKEKPNLIKNHILAWIIARIPFLFFPIMTNFYYIFIAAAIYQIFYRASITAWTEIIKRKINNSRESIFSTFALFAFIEGLLLSFFFKNFVDESAFNWKIAFFVSALISLCSVFLKIKIDVPVFEQKNPKNNVLSPITDVFSLLKNRKDFAHFQLGFSIGGFALILISPALYIFANDVLKITYNDMISARLIFMGFGFILSSFFWKKALKNTSINYLTIWVLLGFSIYILFLLLSKYSFPLFFLAFFFYGIAQAGSKLLWDLSGIYFSKDQNSLLFTSTNLFVLAIRGLIAPILSSILCVMFSPSMVIFVGLTITLLGFFITIRLKKTALDYSKSY